MVLCALLLLAQVDHVPVNQTVHNNAGAIDPASLLWILMGGLLTASVLIHNVVSTMLAVRQLKTANQPGDWPTRTEMESKVNKVHERVDSIMMNLSGEVGKMRGELITMLSDESKKAEKSRDRVQEELKAIEHRLGRMDGWEKLIDQHTDQISAIQHTAPKSR
jgi:hypothetical protein